MAELVNWVVKLSIYVSALHFEIISNKVHSTKQSLYLIDIGDLLSFQGAVPSDRLTESETF